VGKRSWLEAKAAPAEILTGQQKNLTGRPVRAWVAQLVERVLGKDEVTGSIPVPGSSPSGKWWEVLVRTRAGVTQW
jgi:hypothetical protein